MKYKRQFIECSKNYEARIFRYPEDKPNLEFALHWHREYEFIYVEKGPLVLRTLEEEITLNDGDIHFLNTEEVHSYTNLSPELKFIVANFPMKTLKPYFKNSMSNPTFRINKEPARTKIATSFQSLSECKNLEGRIEALKVKAILNNASYYLIKDCEVKGLNYYMGADSDDFIAIKSATSYMEANYKRYISLNEIASYVGMAPTHFSKYFKDKTETTFSKYLRKIRLNHAISDMCELDLSVKEAALNNGFPNVNSFILICKEEYERTPLEMKIYTKTT